MTLDEVKAYGEAHPPTIEELRHIVSVLCKTLWTKHVPDGEHLWSIPADPKRDFDFRLSAAIDELEKLRGRTP